MKEALSTIQVKLNGDIIVHLNKKKRMRERISIFFRLVCISLTANVERALVRREEHSRELAVIDAADDADVKVPSRLAANDHAPIGEKIR